jgi:hypothetical protein
MQNASAAATAVKKTFRQASLTHLVSFGIIIWIQERLLRAAFQVAQPAQSFRSSGFILGIWGLAQY